MIAWQRSIQILGYDYGLLTDRTLEDLSGAMGTCDSNNLIIRVANNIPEQQKQSTVLHEIIEAIDYSLELGLEHRSINSLEAALYQVLCANGVDLRPLLGNSAGQKVDKS